MQSLYTLLRRDEQITLALRSLYERYGYRKFAMNRFEEYDFYAVHRDFLSGGQVITFTDLNGKLMALRPDVTLSIVKKAKGGERIYYSEPVYRPMRGGTGFGESVQVGVEYIGDMTPYAAVEIVSLAAQSLALISPQYILDLSHTGYIGGLLAALPVEEGMRYAIRRCIEEKNAHELATLTKDSLSPEDIDRLMAITRLSGPFPQTLEQARTIACNDEMLAAVNELESLYTALASTDYAASLRLDFSISSDAKYYSGLMLSGYISGVAAAVLSGGRYDPLLRRMGKPQLSAMGFAIYFDELARYLSAEADEGVDTVILYDAKANPADVLKAVSNRAARGERVWAGTSLPDGLRYDEIEEVRTNA